MTLVPTDPTPRLARADAGFPGHTPPPGGPMVAAPADPAARYQLLHSLLGEAACRQLGIVPLPTGFKLSVVIPVYNEERWLETLVRKVQAVPIPKELLLVNDFSTDGTPAVLETLAKEYDNASVFHQQKNQGKAEPRWAGLE